MRIRATLLALAAATGMVSGVINAQEQEQPKQSAPSASPSVPPRGSTMESVRSKFGAPSQESPAVGKPPITRWEYPGYVVYFENDKVLHTVVVK